jgi:hypothetical protein
MATFTWGRPLRKADALATIALLLAAISAAAGSFIPGLYHDTEGWIRQARAADLTTLFAVVPALSVGLWRVRSGSDVGRLAILASLGYLVYNYGIFGFSVAINPMTPVHYAVLGTATWALLLSLIALGTGPRTSDAGRGLPRRATGAFLLAVAALFALMWLGQIAQAISSGTTPEAVANLGLSTNPVYTLDLAFALPFLAVSGVAILRGSGLGPRVALAALMWTALMGLGVLAIFGFDAAAGAAVPLPVAAVIGAITLAAGSLTAVGVGLNTTVKSRRPSAASA